MLRFDLCIKYVKYGKFIINHLINIFISHIINLQKIGLPSSTFSTFPDKILTIKGFYMTKSV